MQGLPPAPCLPRLESREPLAEGTKPQGSGGSGGGPRKEMRALDAQWGSGVSEDLKAVKE